jgi:Flagellar biosynthesis protein, FliO
MRVFQLVRQQRVTERVAAVSDVQRFGGWAMGLLRGLTRARVAQQKQLRLVETLSLGGKTQLMLVTCGEENFLIGCGPESVEAIVRVGRLDALSDGTAKKLDMSCG